MGSKTNVIAYPNDWDKAFGKQYYKHKQANERFASLIDSGTTVSYNPEPLNVTAPSEVKKSINVLIASMQEAQNEFK